MGDVTKTEGYSFDDYWKVCGIHPSWVTPEQYNDIQNYARSAWRASTRHAHAAGRAEMAAEVRAVIEAACGPEDEDDDWPVIKRLRALLPPDATRGTDP